MSKNLNKKKEIKIRIISSNKSKEIHIPTNSSITTKLGSSFSNSTFNEIKLINKIGINNYFWKQTPKGLTDAEGGLYLEPRDLAKFGYLYLNNGLWDGNKILPKNWVKNNSAELIDTIWPAFKYGQQWWFIPYNKDNIAWLASGLGGQRLLIVPEFDIVAVFTGWNVYEITALNSYLALQKVLGSILK